MKTTFLVGMIGFLLCVGVSLVSVLLPILNGPRTSWREAAIGIVLGVIGSFGFLIVLLIGLFQMLNAAVSGSDRLQVRCETKPASVSAVLCWVAAIMLGLAGPILIVLFLPGSLESRRVWLYQQARVEEIQHEMANLQGKRDAASQARFKELRALSARGYWSPETYRDSFVMRIGFVVAGVGCLIAATIIVFIRLLLWRMRPRPILRN